VRYEQLGPAVEQLAQTNEHLEGISSALTPEQLAGSANEAALSELARDATALIGDAEAAIEAGESRETIVTLVNAVSRLAAQVRDQLLDDVVKAELPPDHPPQ
jgi:hypothetical protein